MVLLDDQDHTYEYVVDMLGRVFGHDRRRGFQLAREVDTRGRAVVATTHREHAELKVAQVRAFGADPLLARSAGPMHAVLEPACGHADADRDENHHESGESAGGPADGA